MLLPYAKLGSARTILPLIAWALALGIILGMVLWSSKVFPADVHVYDDGKTSIHLTDAPCTDARTSMFMAQRVPPQYLDKFKAIESVWAHADGSPPKPYAGCWMSLEPKETGMDEPYLILFFDDGEQYELRLCQFLKTCDQRRSRLRI